jgi:hypothetical protein
VDTFRGNMIFSSSNQLRFFNTSRRDDLVSLCYLMIYLIRRGTLPKVDIYNKVSRNESFRRIRDAKLSYKMSDLCNRSEGTGELEDFVREVFSYRFQDEPNYDKLRVMIDILASKYDPSVKCRNTQNLEMDDGLMAGPIE